VELALVKVDNSAYQMELAVASHLDYQLLQDKSPLYQALPLNNRPMEVLRRKEGLLAQAHLRLVVTHK